MSYAGALRTTGWQRRRLEIMQRDGWACVLCGNAADHAILNVHHKRYPGRGQAIWDVPDDALETLCEGCHSATHYPGDMRFEHLTDSEICDAYCTLIAEQLAGASDSRDKYLSAKLDQLLHEKYQRGLIAIPRYATSVAMGRHVARRLMRLRELWKK